MVLPDRKNGLQQLEQSLSEQVIRDCVARLDTHQVNLFLPRFKCTWGAVNVAEPLATLGMTLPFSDTRADFSGINGHEAPHAEALYLSAVFHKAFVEANEEGTEAAAVTAADLMPLSVMPFSEPKPIPTFLADHPFLFMIRDGQSSAVLFVGRMANPSNEGGF